MFSCTLSSTLLLSRISRAGIGVFSMLALMACGDSDSESALELSEPGLPGLAILGGGTQDVANLLITTVLTAGDGLNTPTDLAFNPDSPDELWITNQSDSSMLIALNPDTTDATSMKVQTASGQHFLAKPSALAFGQSGHFASIHDTDEETQASTPSDFMGPTLFSSNLNEFDGGHGGHLDMLHNSPSGKGIAWGGSLNVYWVFDGFHNSITRYDFGGDHGLGGADHSDGYVTRYVQGDVLSVEDIPSHMVLDDDGLLFIADSGNRRIAILDTVTGARGATISPNYDGAQQFMMSGAELTTLVSEGLAMPSGIALHNDILYVTDTQSSKILAFSKSGELLDWIRLDVEPFALAGIAVGRAGTIWVVDRLANEVLHIQSQSN